MIVTDNTTVAFYINKQGGTHSHTLLRLVVDLFMWLQSQDIIVRARHVLGCLNVIADRLSRPNQPITIEWSLNPKIVKRIFRTLIVDMFATVHNTHLPQFMSPIPEPRALAIHALSQDWQGRSMYMFPPLPLLNKSIQKIRSTQEGEVILIAPWWPSQWWFPQLDHPRTIPVAYFQNRDMSRMASRISPRMEALTQHYQEAGFSKEVSRLAAAPRRPLTNRMYNQRWPHFAHRATGQGIHPLGPTAAQIAAFLYYLFDTHGLSPQTIK